MDKQMNQISGLLKREEIEGYITKGDISFFPFERNALTDVGYNLTASEFILSLNNRLLVNIERTSNEAFCYVNPHDTVLIITNESVKVSNKIAGRLHSRVSIVSKGFSNISTLLYPGWQGHLLIALTNPTNRKLKLILGEKKFIENESNNDMSEHQPTRKKAIDNESSHSIFESRGIVTLVFERVVPSEAPKKSTEKQADRKTTGRFDILQEIINEWPTKKTIFDFWKWREFKRREKLKAFIQEISLIGTNKNPDERIPLENFKDETKKLNKIFNHNLQLAKYQSDKIFHSHKWASRIIISFKLIFLILCLLILVYSVYKWDILKLDHWIDLLIALTPFVVFQKLIYNWIFKNDEFS